MTNYLNHRGSKIHVILLVMLAFFCSFLSSGFASAQSSKSGNATLHGRVVATDGGGLPGAYVVIKGQSRGVITDNDGNFTLDRLAKGAVLLVTSLGFNDAEFTYTGTDNVVIILEDQANTLEDAVIVAFGEQKRESVLSSVATINAKDLKLASSNLTTALAGKMPGIISYQTTGEPGADNAQFFVRGVTTFGYRSEPLILVDGFEATSSDLARLQPDDIESFSILKDASAAALYGSRGANGIILVNTKSGHEGPAKINVRIDSHVATPTQMNELVDGVTYMEMYNEAIYTRRAYTGNGSDFYSPQKIQGTREGKYPMLYPNVDWYDELFNKSTMNTKANINVSGGGKVATYYVAAGYDHENGLLKVDDLNNFNNNISINRVNIRNNVIFRLTSSTKLDTRISGRFERYNGPYNSATSIFNMVMNANPVDYPAVYEPDAKTKYVTHTLFGSAEGAPTNPYAEMVRGYTTKDETTINAQATLMQDLGMLTKGLKFQLKASANVYSYYAQARKYSPYYYSILDSDPNTGEYTLYCMNPENSTAMLGNVEPSRNGSAHYYFEARANWERSFGKHNVNAMFVGTAEEYVLTSGNSTNVFETLPERNLCQSGRIAYDYASRYFFEFDYGYNGSEKFAKAYRFGFFPSVGVGWLISNEPYYPSFLKGIMPAFKLKATYGKVGNDAIASRANRFFYLSEINYAADMHNWGIDYTQNRHYTYQVLRYANPEIQWEVSTKTNLGLEMSFLPKESIKIQVDYFTEFRDKIYMQYATYPASAGFSGSIAGNIGQVKSHGVEASMDVKHFFNRDWWITGRANFTYATNEYVKLSEVNYKEPYRSRVGTNINQPYGLVAERLFVDEAEIDNSPKQDFGVYMPGDIKYKDINGDGVIDDADRVPIGYPTVPEIQYGFGLSLGWKKLDFSFFFQGNARVSFFINPTGIAPFTNRRNALKVVANDYWTESNPNVNAFWPRLSTTPLSNNTQTSTWWLRRGDFMRLKSVEIGYTFPHWDLIGMQGCRVYFTGENLMVFSRFKMWDPEMGGNGLGYPINMRFNIGAQFNF